MPGHTRFNNSYAHCGSSDWLWFCDGACGTSQVSFLKIIAERESHARTEWRKEEIRWIINGNTPSGHHGTAKDVAKQLNNPAI